MAVGDVPNGKGNVVPSAGAAAGSGCWLGTQDTTLLSRMRGDGMLHLQTGFLFPNSSGKSQELVTIKNFNCSSEKNAGTWEKWTEHFQIPTQRTFLKASCFSPSAFSGRNGQAEKAQMTPQVFRNFTVFVGSSQRMHPYHVLLKLLCQV